MTNRLFLIIFLVVSAVMGQGIITPLFPYKDGEADPLSFSGLHQDLEVCGRNDRVVAWIIYDTREIDFQSVKRAWLKLFVTGVVNPGTVKVYRLLEPVDPQENAVSFYTLRYDTNQVISSFAIRQNSMEKLVKVDVTSFIKTPPTTGVVLVSDDGLLATFGSKESYLQPIIELEYEIMPENCRGIGSFTWWTHHDNRGSVGLIDSIRFDRVAVTLKTVSGTAPCFAECGVAFHPMHLAMSIRDYAKMVINLTVPTGQKVILQLLQTSITDGDFYSKEIITTGDGEYILPLNEFKQRGSGTGKPLDYDRIWGIKFLVDKPGTNIQIGIRDIQFSN